MSNADQESVRSESEDDSDELFDDEDEDRAAYDKLCRDATWAIKERKGVFTEKDATAFLWEFGEWPKKARDAYPNPLHAIVDLLHSNDIPVLDDVLPLVKQLVWVHPELLWTTNDQKQNPVFYALKRQRSDLVRHMLRYSEGKDNARQGMLQALEGSCDKEDNKTCLHLALETATKAKSSFVVKLVKFASGNALKAADVDNKTALHYAVNYGSCGKRGNIIDAFLERDMEAVQEHRRTSSSRPLQTFLDVKADDTDPTRIPCSVYQEHIATAEVYKKTAERKNLKESAAETHAERVRDEGKNHKAHSSIRPDNEAALRQTDPAKQRTPRDLKGPEREDALKLRKRNKETPGDMAMDEREKLRRQLKEEEEGRISGEQGMPPPETMRKAQDMSGRRDQSRDRVGLPSEPARRVPPLDSQTTSAIVAVGRSGDVRVANTPIKRVRTTQIPQEPAASTIGTKTTGERAKLLAESSESIIKKLKLHYMRTRGIQKASKWLYGNNLKGIQICFDYKGLPPDVTGDLIKKSFQTMHFDDVLMYVHFTDVTVRYRPTPRDKEKEPGDVPGRRDMEFFFDWLHEKGVRRILKLTVEENGVAVHSDASIKRSLDKMVIEHLNWQKMDMDPEIICGISSQVEGKPIGNGETIDEARKNTSNAEQTSMNELRALDLMWSGSNAVLWAWSEPHGLPRLEHLETVNILVPGNVVLYDPEDWIDQRINEFRIRLNENINKNLKKLADARAAEETACAEKRAEQKPKTRTTKGTQKGSSRASERHVSVSIHGIPNKRKLEVATVGITGNLSQPASASKVRTSHEWMESMERFAQKIKPFWEDMLARSRAGTGKSQGDGARLVSTAIEEDVVVALIDDGVVPVNEYFAGRVLEGKTFDYHDGAVGHYYNSHQGHGTAMANLILRMCPMAKIYPIRLKTYLSDDGQSKIELESAALAINAARERNARIISMSWTIPIHDEEQHSGAKPLIENAIKKAIGDKRIMFCSSPDKGDFKARAYPSYKREGSMFRIGAADANGKPFADVEKHVDYICPGVNVNCHTSADRQGDQCEITGSSVATALAAGLAATIIYCFKTAALATKIAKAHRNPQDVMPSTQFTEEHVRSISEHSTMKVAFDNIGYINDAKFIQVWELFDSVSLVLDDPSKKHEDKVESVIQLCTSLMHRRPGVRQ